MAPPEHLAMAKVIRSGSSSPDNRVCLERFERPCGCHVHGVPGSTPTTAFTARSRRLHGNGDAMRFCVTSLLTGVLVGLAVAGGAKPSASPTSPKPWDGTTGEAWTAQVVGMTEPPRPAGERLAEQDVEAGIVEIREAARALTVGAGDVGGRGK